MNHPLVSIIIPTYNRAHLICETLDSVLAQTYQNWECIVVDDGSSDGTDELLASYCDKDARFQYHHRPIDRPKGANACRNYGFEVSKGDFIYLLDSDDICEPFSFKERIEMVTKDPSINLLIRDTSLLKNNKKYNLTINKDPKVKNKEAYLRMFLRYEIPWHTSSTLYKRKLLKTCKFDENLGRFQDVSFNIKVLSQFENLKFVRDYKIDNYYRVDETKILKNNFVGNMLHALIIFYNIHINLINNKNYASDLRKFSCKIILEFVMPYFNENKKESNAIFIWSLKSNLYTLYQKIILLLLMFFLNVYVFHKKGIGMNTFRNYFKKVMNA